MRTKLPEAAHLSWSAFWAGWQRGYPEAERVRRQALEQLREAEGVTLILLSQVTEFPSSEGWDALRRLSEAERLTPEQAQREWQFDHLRRVLAELETAVDSIDPDYDAVVNPFEPEHWSAARAAHLMWIQAEAACLSTTGPSRYT